ncbi:hypothetical protein SNE34_01045 [Lysobacter erysipheiresistens]|uniref:Apea-like HEPN domain-containing protein n=1 Tax=Novilysobacter erysipheiresistens TaxID=1749332 RepID=A0ABU7YUK4_9GAMM
MKFRSLKKWDDPSNNAPLVYFAQLMEELSYDKTPSTYKPSVMHTALLGIELSETIDNVENGIIRAPNIDHVAGEFCSSLSKHPIADKLLNVPSGLLIGSLKNKAGSTGSKQLTVDLVVNQLRSSAYRRACEETVIEQIESAQCSYDILRAATRNYVTTLLSLGYSSKYIHEIVLKNFHYDKNRIGQAKAALKAFFEVFDNQTKKYTLVFKADKIFLTVAEALKELRIEISREPPGDIDLSAHVNFLRTEPTHVYATLRDIPAKEPYAARQNGERIMRVAATFLTLFHHRDRPTWLSDAIVHFGDAAISRLHPRGMNAMHKGADLPPEVAARKMKDFLEKFSLHEEAFHKFMRSAQLHALAAGSSSDENQLLNLWIAIESLIPAETKSSQEATIEHIVNSLLPVLSYDYFERLVNHLVKDLLHWDKPFVLSQFKGIPGKTFTERLLRIMGLPDHATQYDSLISRCRDFALLEKRIDYLKSISASPSALSSLLDGHEERVSWQIRRIYRTRNIIVHSGETPSHTNVLIELAHEYLDNVLNLLTKLASRPSQISTVAEGFTLAQLHYQDYKNSLSQKNFVLSAGTIVPTMFMRKSLRT